MEFQQTSSNTSGVAQPSMPNLYDLDLASSQELQLQLSQVTQNLKAMEGSDTHSVTRDEGLRHIYINDKDGLVKHVARTNPINRQVELKRVIGNYKLCKPTRSGGLLLEVATFQQVQQVLRMESLMGIPVKTVLSYDIGTCR